MLRIGFAKLTAAESYLFAVEECTRHYAPTPHHYELDEIRPWRASGIARDGNEHRDVEPAEQKECWLLLSISSLGAGSNSCIRSGSLTHFDLSIACAGLEAWLWVYGRSVNDMAIVKIKPGSVIRTLNAVVH
jgi:hypothetical protein